MPSLKNEIVLFSFLLFGIQLFGQDKVLVQKSSEIKKIGTQSFYIHHVENGQTVYSILRVYKLSIEEFYIENPKARSGLKIGQILKIPVSDNSVENKAEDAPKKIVTEKVKETPKVKQEIDKQHAQKVIDHVVEANETLYGISRKYNIDIDIIYQENPEAKNELQIGQILKIRVPKNFVVEKHVDDEPQLIEHKVVRKETLYGIAKKYNVTIEKIRKYNPGLRTKIKKGSILYIPVRKKQKVSEPKKAREIKIEEFNFGDLVIQLINSNHLEIKPGSNFNIAIMLVNNSNLDKELKLKITSPESLNQLTDYTSVIVENNGRKLKIFSFYVDEATVVGDYTIEIEIYDKLENIKIGTVEIPVYVKPSYGLEVKVLDAPDYVFSGDTLSVQFMIQNLSNTEVNIQATIINARISENKNFVMAPDSLILLRVFITTEKDIMQYTRNNVIMNAFITESPEIKSEISYVFDVIPTGKIKFDSHNRIPTKISGLFVTNNQTGERNYGYMFDVKGGGMISPSKKREIDFHFRGPNRQGSPILGQTDEYNIKYSSPHSKVKLGDNSYSLTDLTEGSRSGRGIEYEHTLKKLSFGSFINYPRFYPILQRVASVYGSYFIEKKLNVKLGYLNKLFVSDSAVSLISVSGEASPTSWSDIKFEYATGKASGEMAKAYSTDLRVHFPRYRLFAVYTKADENYPGYLSNSQYVSSGLNVSVLRKVDLNLNYNFNHTNMALDTMYANAPYTSNLSLATGYAFNFNHSISIGFNVRGSEDMSLLKLFNYKEYTARIAIRSRIKRLGINAYGAMGKTENFLPLKEGEVTNVLNANLSLQYNIKNNIFAKCFITYSGGQQYLKEDATSFFYGATIDASWSNKLKILLQYQNNYQVEEYYKDRSLLGLQANYRMNAKHEIDASVNYDLRKNALNSTVLSASLKYTYTINLPASRRVDVGGLQGKVINNGVDNVQGILFRLAGNIVFSDKNGEFEIPFVKTGTHFLFMDNAKSGLNSIAETRGPYKIEILPGKKTNFEVSLTKSGKIEGAVIIEEDKNKNLKGFIPVKTKLDKLIIEVNNGIETYRTFTNQDGTFNFNDLRPGEWKLIVYNRGIPDGYKLLTNEFNITLSSTEIKEVHVKIRKISRKIKFQKK